MNDEELLQTLRRCLSELSSEDPTQEELLFDRGILDSFSMLQFILLVEGSLGLSFDPGEINLDNFNSLGRIARFIRSAHLRPEAATESSESETKSTP